MFFILQHYRILKTLQQGHSSYLLLFGLLVFCKFSGSLQWINTTFLLRYGHETWEPNSIFAKLFIPQFDLVKQVQLILFSKTSFDAYFIFLNFSSHSSPYTNWTILLLPSMCMTCLSHSKHLCNSQRGTLLNKITLDRLPHFKSSFSHFFNATVWQKKTSLSTQECFT